MTTPIVLATPHARHDALEAALSARLPHAKIFRLRGRSDLTVNALAAMGPAFVFFPHWSWRIPTEVHEQFACVIFHMTDVPYGRGGTPLQNLIVRGHADTVISALACMDALDAGPVYLKRPLSLAGTAGEILGRADAVIEDMIVEIVTARPEPRPQDGEVVTFARRRPEQGDLSALHELEHVYDHIRMLDAEGYPHAFLHTERLDFRFVDATLGVDFVEARVRIRYRTDE